MTYDQDPAPADEAEDSGYDIDGFLYDVASFELALRYGGPIRTEIVLTRRPCRDGFEGDVGTCIAD